MLKMSLELVILVETLVWVLGALDVSLEFVTFYAITV
jgi:hypothetical protein